MSLFSPNEITGQNEGEEPQPAGSLANGAPSQNEKPLSVFEVTQIIDKKLTGDSLLRNIAVAGELLDFKHHSSGHAYFTLTDKTASDPKKKAVLKCTFFRFPAGKIGFTPKPGLEVIAIGSVGVYYQGGQYNFNAKHMIELGQGNLLLRVQELKNKLIAEGVINPSLRKPIPRLPRRIGIVTGLGTAALKDIFKQARDRYPHVEILVAPALVQGEEAPRSVAAALREITDPKWKCDLVIVGRGGGSMEDLMPFNDELVCRAIHESSIPVISAVGHQIDHPVCDDVADVAAATPTDGAKIALPVIEDLLHTLSLFEKRIDGLMKSRFDLYREKLKRMEEKPFYDNPAVLIDGYYQYLDDKENRLNDFFHRLLRDKKELFLNLPDIPSLMERYWRARFEELGRLKERLHAFSPLATLKRGFALVYQEGKIRRLASEIDREQDITIKMFDEELRAKPYK